MFLSVTLMAQVIANSAYDGFKPKKKATYARPFISRMVSLIRFLIVELQDTLIPDQRPIAFDVLGGANG